MKRILTILLLLVFYKVNGQNNHIENLADIDHGAAVSLNLHYDVPQGKFADMFKPTMAYGINLVTFHDNWTINYSLGRETFKPKADLLYYQVDDTSIGTVHYEDYTSTSAYLGFSYNFRVADHFWIFTGLNFGAYFTRFAYHSVDKYIDAAEDLHETNIYLAPKAGFTIPVSNSFFISIESKYNFFAPTGKVSDNAHVGTLYQSFANGVSVTYKF